MQSLHGTALFILLMVRPLAAAESYQAVGFVAGSEEDAKSRVTALIDTKLYAKAFGLKGDLPRVVEPNSLLGAPKDRWFVLLSICPTKKSEAKKIAAAIKPRAKDVTVFAVKNPAPDLCLPRRAFDVVSDEESALIQGVLKDPQHAKPRTRYATFLQDKNRLEEAEAQLRHAIEAEPGDFEAKNLLQVVQVMRQP